MNLVQQSCFNQYKISNSPKKLPDQTRDKLQFMHLSIHAEKSNVFWIRRIILFVRKFYGMAILDPNFGE